MTDFLEPLLTARLVELEASAGEPDWTDVRRKARRLGARRLMLGVGAPAAIVLLAVLIAAPAFGLRGRLVHLFADSEPAPSRVVQSFGELDKNAPSGMATGVIPNETRVVARFPLATGRQVVLSVAPTHSGGFCFDYSNAGGGCDRDRELRFGTGLAIPGPFSPVDGEIDSEMLLTGNTLIDRAATVEIRFEDGESAKVPLVWVSPPIDAGFFLYEVPQQHRRVGHFPELLVLEDADGHELVRAKSFVGQVLEQIPPADRSDGVPPGAISSQRRELIAITSEEGTREALWVAPRRGGGRCEWLTSNGDPGRFSGCPPPPTRPPAPDGIAVSLISGSAPILLEAEVGAGVAMLELHYHDGDIQRLKAVDGYVLGEIPSRHWSPGRRLYELVALDAEGREISRRPFSTETPGTYPCSDPIELGAGVKSCP